MEREGEIYSPVMTLNRSSEEALERDLWECAHAGVCHSIYRYGTHGSGGSYCREITHEVAARLGRLSLAMRRKPAEPVCVFLETFAVEFFGKGEGIGARDLPAYPPFEMRAPQQEEPSRTLTRRKSRGKRLSPEELRAQPQLKLPISGGRDVSSSRLEAPTRNSSTAEPSADDAVERLSLRDERPLAEQAAAWERFDRKLRAIGVKGAQEPKHALAPEEAEADAPRTSTAFRS
jgi:hypothetical protein